MRKRIKPLLFIMFTLALLGLALLVLTACELITPKPEAPIIYALYISLDYYNSALRDLNGTLRDARELATAIQIRAADFGVEVFSTMMIQEGDASEIPLDSNIEYSLYPVKTQILQRIHDIGAHMRDNDVFLLYFSGHGGGYSLDDPDLGFLVTAKPSASSNVEYELISDSELRASLSNILGTKLLILDSCYSGQYLVEYPIEQLNRDRIIEETGYDPDLYYLIAAAPEELSWETFLGGHMHGHFSYYLLKALGWNHNGSTTISIANNGTFDIDDSFSLTVSGNIQNNSIAPAQQGTQIRISTLSHMIPLGIFYDNGVRYPQHTQTGKGPMDMILFDSTWE